MNISVVAEFSVELDERIHSTELDCLDYAKIADSVNKAVEDALRRQEKAGFNHPLDGVVSLELESVKKGEMN